MLKKQDCKDKYFCVRLYILANFYFFVTLYRLSVSEDFSRTNTISIIKK